MKPEELVLRYQELSDVKQNWLSHWQEIVNYMMPYRQGVVSKNAPGQKTMGKIHDSTAIYAQFLFAAGLHGMMTNPATPWFNLAMKDKFLNQLHQVKQWCFQVQELMYDILNESNWGTQVNEAYLDYGGFGMFVMFMGEDFDDVVFFNKLDLGECVIGEDSKGRVDTFIRCFEWSARQLVQEFGLDKVSEDVKKVYSNKPNQKFEVMHGIYPRTDYVPGRRISSGLPFASLYLEKNSRNILSDKGYNEFPILAPRFSVSTGEVYARGPGMIALPDVKQLNQMDEDMMRAAQKKIDPPIMVARNSFTGPVRFTPGATSVVRATSVADKMAPFPVPGDLGYGEKKEEQKRESIGRIFYNNILQVVQQDRMTAAEFLGRSSENLRLMGPMLGRLQYEFLKPLVFRLFGVLHRRNLLPPAPEVIVGRKFKAAFVSPLAKAQRLNEAQGISRTIEIALPVMQIKPEIADNFDWDATIRFLAEANSMPAILMKDPKLVTTEREQRDAEIKKQQGLAQAGEMSKMAPNLAKGAEANSPMAAIMDTLKGTAQNAVPEMGQNPMGLEGNA